MFWWLFHVTILESARPAAIEFKTTRAVVMAEISGPTAAPPAVSFEELNQL